MANTKLNGNRKRQTPRAGSVTFADGVSAWRGRGQTEESRRVMVKLPGVPLFSVPQGTSAEAAILNLLDS